MRPITKTVIRPEQARAHRERQGFQPVCCYGDLTPEEGEIGGIFKSVRNTRLDFVVHG